MVHPPNDGLFSSDLWEAALEKYAGTTHLTVRLFDAEARAVFGPVHPTPMFQLFEERGYDPGIFVECARRCLAQTDTRPAVTVSQVNGLAAVGTSLMLEGKIVGVAVGGYVFMDFVQASDIQGLARHAGMAFQRVWKVVRTQPPVPQRRLLLHGELLQVLGDALLREHHRTRQYERAAAIIESSDDAIISEDLNGVIRSWNRGAERLFGYTAQEAMSRPITMLMPADRFNEEPDIVDRIRHGQSIDHYETVRRRKDGTLLDISLTVSPVVDEQGRIVGASKVARDITERKRAEAEIHRLLIVTQAHERELSEKQTQLVQAGKLVSLGELAAGVAHEINNPLNNIGLFLNNVLDRLGGGQAADEKSQFDLNMALSQVEKAAAIVAHLRAFGRSTPMTREPLNLNLVLRSALSFVQEQLRLRAVEVMLDLADEEPTVIGNPTLLEQVLINLLINARDAVEQTPRKQIIIRSAVQDGRAHITVQDTGGGIPTELLSRIFDPFFTTKEVGKGTGLGLSISYSIIREHEGQIAVESQPGQGTSMVIQLPLAAASGEPVLNVHGSLSGAGFHGPSGTMAASSDKARSIV